ncbi:MAG: DUF2272 domain-containing protein [Acetobacteraceae bacterium]|nr:DUF2272 domain-containing protein [Acetobacteraceae bacterium]
MQCLVPFVAVCLLAGCAASRPAPPSAGGPADIHVPPFAKRPYEPFSRASVVAVAAREWRLFDRPVDDDPPGARPRSLPEEKPERFPGLWQRVGEYWWLGMNNGTEESAWTGKHDASGYEFPAGDDGSYAWSAAFVSYVFRIAGAGPRFPYSWRHADYINVAKQMALHQTSGWLVTAERPEAYAPLPGDLICLGRGPGNGLRYDDLPTAYPFPGHCDIVITAAPGQLAVIGGNVDDAVTLKHVPTTPDGKLATPDGTVVDGRYPWMVVLRVLDQTPVS